MAAALDGIHFRDSVILIALGIDTKGNKHVLGLREVVQGLERADGRPAA